MTHTTSSPRRRLVLLGAAVLVLELIATAVAVALDLPAQFGGAGTDAGAEFASRGTAISPPLAPLAVLAVALVLLRRRGALAQVGCVLVAVLGVLFAIGSLGEAAAPATAEVPRAVLLGSGVTGVLLGAALLLGAVRAFPARSAAHPAAARPRT